MAGIIFLGVSVIAFIGLIFYIKKSGNSVNKDLMDELYDKKSVKKENSNDTIMEDLDIEKGSEENLSDSEENSEVAFEEYTYDTYKSDEEYLRVARLVKNIYYGVVCVVIMVLGILYIVLFKI